MTTRSLPSTTGAKPTFLSSYKPLCITGSHWKKGFLGRDVGFRVFMALAFVPGIVINYKKQHDCIVRFCCCNSSPRGDGNVNDKGFHALPPVLQFIPARGRKPLRPILTAMYGTLQFIPARGRKPTIPIKWSILPSSCNSSPRGDGNVQCMAFRFGLYRVAIHPREGTETQAQKMHYFP